MRAILIFCTTYLNYTCYFFELEISCKYVFIEAPICLYADISIDIIIQRGISFEIILSAHAQEAPRIMKMGLLQTPGSKLRAYFRFNEVENVLRKTNPFQRAMGFPVPF